MESSDLKAIVYFQIFVLIFSLFAFSYLTAENSKYFESKDLKFNEEKPKENILSKVIELLGKLTKESIPLASAQEEQFGCCLETKSGEFCKEVAESECKEGFSLGTCSEKEECQLGCCYDSFETTFSKNSYKGFCGGLWNPSPTCNINIAREGCCYISSNDVRYVTQGMCKSLVGNLTQSNDYKWDGSISEYACSLVPSLLSKGACVLDYGEDNSRCMFIDLETCSSEYDGTFIEGKLCTAEELNTSCEPTGDTRCVNGRVYFKDSCGNIANIYDSSKVDDTDYWTNYYSVYESCNDQEDNCGNCDGRITSCIDGTVDARCENVGCKFEHPITKNTEEYNHLDQWCVYESQIGGGHDVPGSEHYLATCNYGNVTYGSLAEGRKSICTTLFAEEFDGSYSYEKNQEYANPALGCLGINEEYPDINERISKCEAQNYCEVGMVYFNSDEGNEEDKTEHITNLAEIKKRLAENAIAPDNEKEESIVYCYPSYPSDSNIGCPMASMTFEVDLKYKWITCNDENPCESNGTHISQDGVWKEFAKVRKKFLTTHDQYLVYDEDRSEKLCKDGACYAFNQEFVEAMNSYCMSLGDCGVSANVGRYIDPSRLSVTVNPNNLSESYLEILKRFATPTGDEKIIYNITEPLRELTNGTNLFSVDSDMASTEFLEKIYGDEWTMLQRTGGLFASSSLTAFGGKGMVDILGAMNAFIGQFVAILAVSYAAGGLTQLIGQEFQAPPKVINTAVITSISTTFVLSSAAWIAWGAAALWWALPVALAIGILVATTIYLFNLDRTVQTITFSCNEWMPLPGSEHCEECGSDGLPCSEYKCKSFGTGCGIEKTPEGDKCVALEQPPYHIPSIEELKIYKLNDYIAENGADNLIYSEGNLITYNPQGFFESNSLSNQEILDVSNNPSPSPADVGFTVSPNVDPYDYLFIIFNTTEYSECKLDMDEENVKYEDFQISMFKEGTDFTSKSHYYILQYPDLTGGAGSESGEAIPVPLFIRCLSRNNLESPRYLIRFDINPGKDLTPPYIIYRNPKNNSYVSYDTMEREVSITLDRPVESCRWDKEDKEFYSMQKIFNCTGDKCLTNLSLSRDSTKETFYIRCKDENGNINLQSMTYTLNRPQDKIQIDSISPSNGEKIKIGTPRIELKLNVTTSGGTEDHYCYYNYLDYFTDVLTETGDRGKHSITFTAFNAGVHTVNITCEDWNTKDKVEKQTTFEIIHDQEPPKVLQNYMHGNKLYIKTDEPSACYYSTNNSLFLLENGTKMEIGYTIEKMINNPLYNILYYIQCEDEFNNYGYIGKYQII